MFSSMKMKKGSSALSLFFVCLATEFTSAQSKYQSSALANSNNLLSNRVSRDSWLRALLIPNLKNVGLLFACLPFLNRSIELVLKINYTKIMDSGSFTTRCISNFLDRSSFNVTRKRNTGTRRYSW